MARLAWIAAIGLGLGVALLACGGSAEGRGQGIVVGLDPEARNVTLEHGDIPGVMKAMTMTFALAPEVALEGIEVGAPVYFRVNHEAGVYTVVELQRAGP